MHKKFFSLTSFAVLFLTVICYSQIKTLPNAIYSGAQGSFHVQGIVVDSVKGFAYFSFTDRLVKTDLQGRTIGSVTGFVGHLGDLAMAPDGKIYGSLEYKNDAIGKGIQKKLGTDAVTEDGFYVAVFDPLAIVRPDMNAEQEGLLSTIFLKEPTDDYNAEVIVNGRTVKHRFACSGIDGITFAPEIGSNASSKKFLYVAYGIYGDTSRNDNDHQVILKYDVVDWSKYSKKLSQQSLHRAGPAKPLEKYFVKTGNTKYGIQNLDYDPYTGLLFAAVYRGSKPQYPNYDLFVIDASKKATNTTIMQDGKPVQVSSLALWKAKDQDLSSGISGWYFPYGSTGLYPIGDGSFYLSHPGKTTDGKQETTIHRYLWLGGKEKAFDLKK